MAAWRGLIVTSTLETEISEKDSAYSSLPFFRLSQKYYETASDADCFSAEIRILAEQSREWGMEATVTNTARPMERLWLIRLKTRW